jgi:hypothetical protein
MQIRNGFVMPQLVDVMNTFMGIHEINQIMNVNPTQCGLSGTTAPPPRLLHCAPRNRKCNSANRTPSDLPQNNKLTHLTSAHSDTHSLKQAAPHQVITATIRRTSPNDRTRW